ncbi:GNAT family N-acetyltransferase [Macrococcus capreoli]|uniref:GNAT family N-acetyltransferase n=1 Tax=Macrococcus capreoli TaxID=2982690 RepID=UPI0021D5EC0B|nr:GNAT family N-acetyltransferase [Macrococcus sp. TMW 2.2395]MCU7557550.1 GNAT family N-acetyltransferase [Macrococcus sp. TMW 2.2395]
MIKINESNIKLYKDDIVQLIDYIQEDKNQSVNKYVELLKQYIYSENTYVYGHVFEGKLVSFIWFFKRNFNGIIRFHISYISTNPDYRGKGFARELINKVHEISIKEKISMIDLNVSPDNKVAMALYEKLDFMPEKILLSKKIEGVE